MFKKIVAYLAIAIGIMIIPVYIYFVQTEDVSGPAIAQGEDAFTVVIDPGHGGMDGGAVSSLGTEEKSINLAIAKKLEKLLAGEGYNVIMTREKDEGLYPSGDDTIRNKKVSDMKERRRIIDESGANLVVSVHLNSFPQNKSVYGAQCFFPENPSSVAIGEISKGAAESIQEELEKNIDDGRERPVIGKGDLYLFTDCIIPTVLVECGFLSNPEEEKALKSPKIQQIMAKSIAQGIVKNKENLLKKREN